MTGNKEVNSMPDEVFISQKTWVGGTKGALHLHLKMPEPFANQEVQKYTISPSVPVDTINIKREEWQLIDTAPKVNHKNIWGICPVYGEVTVYWCDQLEEWQYAMTNQHCQPTHWMPLPASPKLASLDAVLAEGK